MRFSRNKANVFVSIIMFSPAIFVTLLLPLLIIQNWFDDRKYGKTKRIILSKKQKHFLFLWLSIWLFGFLIFYVLWGIENLVPVFILLFPILLVAFCIPIFIVLQKKQRFGSGMTKFNIAACRILLRLILQICIRNNNLRAC